MKNTKRSITAKIIAGYILAGLLAVFSFWVIYGQITSYTTINEIKSDNNEKLFLVSDALTDLYEAETLTLNIIKTGNTKNFNVYKSKIDTILNTINDVAERSNDTIQIHKIDSLKKLIDSKNNNLEELVKIYNERKDKGVYKTAIEELKKIDDNFYDSDYKKRWKNSELSPHSKNFLIKLMEYTREDNANTLTTQTVDSLANSVKKVLIELEQKMNTYKRRIGIKENQLLENDQVISKQLRDLLANIEQNEIDLYNSRVKASKEVLDKTSNIIAIVAGVSVIIAILFLFLITKDVSKSQRYRTELESVNTYTNSLLKSRESLINTVTHDLRSPLNTVIGYSELLQKTILDNKQKYYLDHLKRSSDYILHLVNDLLDLSKLEAGKMIVEDLPFEPKKLIENTISSVIPIEDKKNLDIHVNTSKELQNQYIGDPFRIRQILINLINNAYKFTDRGSITINGLLEHKGKQISLVISVRDTGIGISKEQQKYIFDEFSQGEDDIEKRYEGFGLGLAITKKIIHLLDGIVTLESTPREGSNFTLRIPIKTTSQINEETTQPKEEDTRDFSSKLVLIVDDEPSQLALTSEVASLIGLSYDTCNNAKSALNFLSRKKYDLVLTDIQMPRMDGFDFLKAVKKDLDLKSIPVIALSGRTDVAPSEYLLKGFTASLRKPYVPNALIDLIADILNIESVSNINPQVEIENTYKGEGYSLEDLMVFAQGDPDSLYAILDTFFDSTEQNLNALRASLETKDIEKIKQIAHKILPMFRQIKATKIVPVLEKLEHPDNYSLKKTEILKLSSASISDIETLIEKLTVNTSKG